MNSWQMTKIRNLMVTTTHLNHREWRSEKCERGLGGVIISIQGQLKTALMHSNYKTSASIQIMVWSLELAHWSQKKMYWSVQMMCFWILKPCKKVCSDSSEEYAVSIFRVNEFGSGDCCSISIHLNQIRSPHIWRQHVPLKFVKNILHIVHTHNMIIQATSSMKTW